MRRRLTITAMLAALALATMAVAAALAPLLAPFGETEVVGDPWQPVSAAHWLGTDNLGRDMLSRLMFASRSTIAIALGATLISFAIGVPLAFTAAVRGGLVDQAASRGVDVLMSVPTLIFALVVLSMLGSSVAILIAVMALLDSTRVFRLARSVAVDVLAQDYAEAARLRGESLRWMLGREILPNTLPVLVAEFGLRFSFTALFLSSLSFLGLGLQPPYADLGGAVKENVSAIALGVEAPLYPAVAIAVLTVSVNLLVDWWSAGRGR